MAVALTVRQRTVADKRAQAWQRITWCLDRITSDNEAEAALGWDIYTPVTDSPLITRTERDVLRAVATRASVALYERDGLEVPQWIRDAAEGRPTTPPAEQP